MIFRKVSDVKKERELAERRKDDPALNQTQGDHHNLKSTTKLIQKASAFVYILKICFCLCKMS